MNQNLEKERAKVISIKYQLDIKLRGFEQKLDKVWLPWRNIQLYFNKCKHFFQWPYLHPWEIPKQPQIQIESTFPISNYRGDSSVVSACVTSVVESDPQEW